MPLADRRTASRFEIVGGQWGTLDALEPLRVRNVSPDGMLLESPNPLAVGSIHEFQLIDGTTAIRVHAAVRHLSPLRQSIAERYFLVGLEFLSLDARSSGVIEQWLPQPLAQPTPNGPEVEHDFVERRSSLRASTEAATLSAVHVSVPVRLLDLGSDGLMMACWAPMRVGSTVRVVGAFAGRRLDVELSVRHVSGQWDERTGGYVVGGSFPLFDAAARQIITALLAASGLSAAGEVSAAVEPVPQVARGRSDAPVRAAVRRERPVRRRDQPRPDQPRPDQASWSASAS